jgi:antitoxin (DNA-binding transcriptional repressor) of toxin-antitoxin stability system
MIVTVRPTNRQLSKLVDLLDQSNEVVLVRDGHPVARLVLANSSTKPLLGGEISWEEGWERALTLKAV